MEKNFETASVEVATFINLFIIDAAQLIIGAIVVSFVLCVMLKLNSGCNATLVARFLFTTFKSVLSMLLVVMIFFYNYNFREIAFALPETMNVGTLFTGILAVYEFVDSLADMAKVFFDIIPSNCNHN